MPIKVACECGRRFNLPDKAAGRRFTCKSCGESVAVPGPQRAKKKRRRRPADEEEDWLDMELPASPAPKATGKRKARKRRKGPGAGKTTVLVLAQVVGIIGLLYGILAMLGALLVLVQMGLVPAAIVGVSGGLALLGGAAARGKGLSVSRDHVMEGPGARIFGIVLVVVGILFLPIASVVGKAFLAD